MEACLQPSSNNPQFDRASRSARALISPSVFSSTGSRPWISTIRLVQRRRAVGNSGFWGNRWKHPRPGFEICYRTLREYKPGVRECGGGNSATSPSVLHTFPPDPLCRQPSNPTRPSAPAIHQRREHTVWDAITSAQPTITAVSAAVDLPSSWRYTHIHKTRVRIRTIHVLANTRTY